MTIRSHSFKPEPTFFHGTAELVGCGPYVGAELEFGYPETRDAMRGIGELLDLPWCYLKDDGSVGGEHRRRFYAGVELVTHPFTEAWQTEQRDTWTRLLQELRRLGCLSGAAMHAGLHLHLGRTGFEGTKHLYRFMRLFYEDKRWTQLLSGREVSELNQWASLEDPLMRVGRKVVNDAKGDKPNFRYAGINLVPQNTVEVRLFSGTLNPRRFLARVEAMFAALQFTREEQRTKLVTPRQFSGWVQQHPERFPHLLDTLRANSSLGR